MKISSLKISTHIVTIMNIIHPLDQHKYNKSYMMIISLGIFILFDNEEIMNKIEIRLQRNNIYLLVKKKM